MKIQGLIIAVVATTLAPRLSAAQPTGAVPRTAIARGTVVEDSLYSPALGVSKRFMVYLPASYAADKVRRYPVAYYLHGTGGNERSWVVGLAIDSVADSLFDHGTSPMILVMPDGDNGYYHTWQTSPDYATCMKWRTLLPYGEPAADYCVRRMHYDDYIAHDLVARVDSAYRTIADRDHRAVAGMSMGGYGAVYLPLRYPDVFAAGASLSGAGLALLRIGGYPDSTPAHEATSIAELHAAWEKTWPQTTEELGTNIDNWRQVDPASMVRRMVAQHKPIPPLWLMVGTEDTSTLEVNRMFHRTLTQLGVKHEYFELPGGHTMAFWRDHEGESIAWIAGVIAR